MKELLQLPVRVQIASDPAHLPIVRATVERVCDVVGFDDQAGAKIALAVDEALTNVIRHAYHGQRDRPIEITFSCVESPDGAESLRIELRDWGTPAEAKHIRSRDLADVRPGGLGVHIITTIMDEVQYQPGPEGGTRLTMTKRL